jgi:hypothetical protein
MAGTTVESWITYCFEEGNIFGEQKIRLVIQRFRDAQLFTTDKLMALSWEQIGEQGTSSNFLPIITTPPTQIIPMDMNDFTMGIVCTLHNGHIALKRSLSSSIHNSTPGGYM